MRGKGKGKDQTESRRSPQVAPDYTFAQSSSCYKSIVEQNEDRFLSLSDLDSLQFELERMLVSVIKRKDGFEDEMKRLSIWQEKNVQGKKLSAKAKAESSSGKRSSVPQVKPSKKPSKKNNNKPVGKPPAPVGRPKSSSQHRRTQDVEHTDTLAVPKYQRNDAPSRFWESLKPYCVDITNEHIKFLEEWAKPDEEIDFKIPPLGKHYTSEWSRRDIQDEEKEGSKANDKQKGLNYSSAMNSSEYENPPKRMKQETESDDSCPFGPLTQRLVSCLMGENIMSSLEDIIASSEDIPEVDMEQSNNANIIKSLNIGDPMVLEKRIRKNLEIAGILDSEEADAEAEEDQEDEVLVELKKIQQSLKAISNHNLNLKQKLLKLAKAEIVKQELWKKLHVVDAGIIELHNKSKSLREKGGSLSEEDKKQALNLLGEREKLLKLIEPEETN